MEWLRPGSSDPGYYDISVVPLFGVPGDLIGVGVSFVDVTRYRRVRDELAYANTELERAYEELQSLNEELETTNEELQSTNEELETMNEELQSTNDELQVINEELRGRTEELDQTNSFLGALDIGLPAADIAPWLRGVLIGTGDNSTSTMSLSALNRRGKTVDLRVAASPMRSEEGSISGLILVIDQTGTE